MLFAACAGICVMATEVDGAGTGSITGETNVVKTEGTLTYEIKFFESDSSFSTLEITYTAKLTNSSGTTQSSAVSPSSGTLKNGVSTELTITAPKTAGSYTLTVVFKETINDGSATTSTTSTKSVVISVVKPITLSITLANNSNVDFTDFTVFFYVDGVKLENSDTLVTVAAGDSVTVTYDWVTDSLSDGKHVFKVVAAEDSLVKVTGLDTEHSFYNGQSNYGLVSILMGIFLVILIIIAVYVYRKPVKNYGKPKARR